MKPLSEKAAIPASSAMLFDMEAKSRSAAGESIINFCVGEPDTAVPEAVVQAGHEALEQGMMKYTPAAGTSDLKKAVCGALHQRHGLEYEPSQIAVTTGGKYAVYAAVSVLAGSGDEVILPAPYWTSYYNIIKLAGATPVVVRCLPEKGWKITPEQIRAAVTDRTKAIILNNPCNPSGAVYCRQELAGLAEAICEADLYTVADEIYDAYVYGAETFVSAAAISPDMKRRTVLVGGMSKSYAMTGWRIGFAAAEPEITRAMTAFLSHTTGCPNTMAQYAAEKALINETDEYKMIPRLYDKRCRMLTEGLSDLPGISFPAPEGAFYVMLICSGPGTKYADGEDFARHLLDESGVAVVPCRDYGVPEAVRLSYSVSEETVAEGIRRIRKFILES